MIITPRRRRCALIAAMLLGLVPGTLAASPAFAHGEGDSDQASVLVLQAIALITNAPDDMDSINDKMKDALEAPEVEGVDLEQVRMAVEAMDSENLAEARTLLQQSLSSAEVMAPVTGEETGTTVVHDSLVTRGHLSITDWVVLATSVLLAGLGAWLTVRYRPAQSVRALRRQLAASPSSSSPTNES